MPPQPENHPRPIIPSSHHPLTSSPQAPRPAAIPPDFQPIPNYLKNLPRWSLWRYELNPDGTWGQAIYRRDATPGISGGTLRFDQVREEYQSASRGDYPYDGIAFTAGEGIAVIEIRGALDENDELRPWVRRMVDQWATYADISPKGTGLKLFVQATAEGPNVDPTPHPEGGTIAAWHQERRVTVTGRFCPIDRPHQGVQDRTNQYKNLVKTLQSVPCATGGASALKNKEQDSAAHNALEHSASGTEAVPMPLSCATGFASALPIKEQDSAPRSTPEHATVGTIPSVALPVPSSVEGAIAAASRTSGAAKPTNTAPENKEQDPTQNNAPQQATTQPRAAPPSSSPHATSSTTASDLERRVGPETQNTKHETRSSELPRWLTHEDLLREQRRVKQRLDEEFAPPNIANQIIELAISEFRIGRTPADEPFAIPLEGPRIAHLLRGGSDSFRKLMAGRYYEKFKRAAASSSLTDALNVLQYKSTAAHPEELHLRVASLPCAPCATGGASAPINKELDPAHHKSPEHVVVGIEAVPSVALAIADASEPPGAPKPSNTVLPIKELDSAPEKTSSSAIPETRNTKHETLPPPSTGIILDLGTPDGKAVEITAHGWHVLNHSPVLFRRTSFTGQLPLPEPGGRLDDLRALVNVSDEVWQLLRGWLVAALFPSIAHPILFLNGETGADRTAALTMLTGLVDASTVPTHDQPSDTDKWLPLAHASWCVALDNVSSISQSFADDLSRTIAGRSFARRRPYSDGDFNIVAFRRVIALSGTGPGPLTDDLAAQMLAVDLEPIDGPAYFTEPQATESERLAQFKALKPQLFGALLDEVAATLRNLPSVELDHPPRMAEFARILAALPLPPDTPAEATPLAIYRRYLDRLPMEVLETDPVAAAVSQLMQSHISWVGTATELLTTLKKSAPDRNWPKGPQYLSGHLKKLAPALRANGIAIDYAKATNYMRTRQIHLRTFPIDGPRA